MIKKIIAYAVDKAILNHILFILMLIMAIFAYKSIPKELFPPANLDKISISGAYAGTSADILDKMAVKPIEDELKNVDNISEISSTIKNGLFNIQLELKEDSDPQIVLNDVKDVVANSKRDLPSDMNEPISKSLIYSFPLLLIAVSGDVSKDRLLDASKKLKSQLSSIKELGQIDIRGDSDYEMKISIDYKKVEALNLNITAIYSAVSNLSSIFPAGTFKNRGSKIYISSSNGEKDVEILKNSIITVGRHRVKLKDIAKVTYGLTTSNEISTFNGKDNISLNVTKLEQGNAIVLSKRVKQVLKRFEKEYKDINFKVYTDTSLWIRNRINLVTSNIFFGLILVFLSILLSVNWKISAVVAMGIPTSFFIGLIAAEYLGYSINMLSMLGALLALGMLVDEAIVVAENIYRHLEMGKSPRDAAIDGATEMFPAVLTATATTIFAFLPMLIMTGKMGMFIKILPVMISILLLSSLFEAFYFLPLHAKELFSIGKIEKEHNEHNFWINTRKKYINFINTLLKFKKSFVFLIIIAILVSTVAMFKISKFELFPKFDAEQIYLSGKVNVNNSLEETRDLIEPLEKRLLKDLNSSNVSSITTIIGINFKPDNTFENGDHLFQIFINLSERKPQNFFDKYINPYLSLEYDDSGMKRDKSAFNILEDAKKSILKYKEIKSSSGEYIYKDLSVYVPQTGIVGSDIEIGIVSKDNLNPEIAIKEFQNALSKIKGVESITSNKVVGPKELKLKINKYGQELGFSEKYLINELRGLFLEAEYGKMLSSIGIVRIKLQEISKDKNFNIQSVYVSTPDGTSKVKLKDIADFLYIQSPLVLYKDDAKRVWSVTAQTTKGIITASEVMTEIEPTLELLKKRGFSFIIKGEQKENNKVKREMSQAAIMAIFFIFISLVLMFNSVMLPILTISVIPLSILGALIGTKLLGINLTMPGVMGIVGLAGVVVNDAIIMLDFIKGSKDSKEIALKASSRLRPIFLTSVTTVLGLSTLMFFASGQALIIQPMAISLGFGVAWATVLNLIYIPLIYSVIYRVKYEESI